MLPLRMRPFLPQDLPPVEQLLDNDERMHFRKGTAEFPGDIGVAFALAGYLNFMSPAVPSEAFRVWSPTDLEDAKSSPTLGAQAQVEVALAHLRAAGKPAEVWLVRSSLLSGQAFYTVPIPLSAALALGIETVEELARYLSWSILPRISPAYLWSPELSRQFPIEEDPFINVRALLRRADFKEVQSND